MREVICEECHQKVEVPPLAHKQRAHCPRCDMRLTCFGNDTSDRVIAFSFAGLIFLGLSLAFGFLSLEAKGLEQAITIPQSIAALKEQGYLFLALLLSAVILALPALVFLLALYLHGALRFDHPIRYAEHAVTCIFLLLPWCMVEIFLIGVLVSIIKIVSMADINLGLSFYAYILFTLCMSGTTAHLDRHQLNKAFAIKEEGAAPVKSALNIQGTWALLITSILLYIPANVLPIMDTRMLGKDTPSTILGGINLLWTHGSYPIAIVIFIASVFVPVIKLIVLFWLNISVQIGAKGLRKERIFWYRTTELIGRWSMVDVFVVAILVSLVQLGNTMSILPGPAAIAFCGVVITTMLAAMNFDSRLIWNLHKNDE